MLLGRKLLRLRVGWILKTMMKLSKGLMRRARKFWYIICLGLFFIFTYGFSVSTIFRDAMRKESETIFPDCMWPHLDPFDRSISKFIFHPNAIVCPDSQPNMAALDPNGNLYVALNSSIQCFYREITGALHPKSMEIILGDLKRIRMSPITVPLNQFEVTCSTKRKRRQITDRPDIAESKARSKQNYQLKDGRKLDETKPFYRQPFMRVEPIIDRSFSANSLQKLSVDILVLDSVSLSQFSRHMKGTLAYMREQMGFLVFEKAGKVGDNTLPNLITLLTGQRYYEPAHAKMDNLTSDYPTDRILKADSDFDFIWRKFSDSGCVTMLHSDPVLQEYGFLFYPKKILQGFTKPPTDYYYRPIHQYFINHPIEKQKVKFCRGSYLYHDMVLELSRQWYRVYRDICHFSLTLALHDYTHDNPAHLELLDAPLLEHFKKLQARNELNNTIFILLGDHGNRLSPIKFSSQGEHHADVGHTTKLLKASKATKLQSVLLNRDCCIFGQAVKSVQY